MRMLLALTACLLLTGAATADCRRGFCNQVVEQVAVEDVVVQETFVPVVTPLAVFTIPTFSYVSTLGGYAVAAPPPSLALPAQQAPSAAPEVSRTTPTQKEGPPRVPGKGRSVTAGPSTPTGISVDPRLLSILRTKCASCHTAPAGSGGGLALFNQAGQLLDLPREVRYDCWDQTYSGDMPKNGPELSSEEVELFRLWARQKDRRAGL